MSSEDSATPQPADVAGRAAFVDAGSHPLRDAFCERAAGTFGAELLGAVDCMHKSMKPMFESLVEQLRPALHAIARAARSFVRWASDQVLAVGRCLYEALLVFLAVVPGGRHVVQAFRAAVDPILYPDFRCPRLPTVAVAGGTPPSRVTSPRRLVSRSTRSLRGPSAVLGIPHQGLGAALT